SRYISRPIDSERYEDIYDPNTYFDYVYRPNGLATYLSNLALEMHDGKLNDGGIFERRTKSIRKGDPREFMG
ncbi:unnamed protein product, partial [Rotaria sp. Silwood2]